jgi:hypothetical protein
MNFEQEKTFSKINDLHEKSASAGLACQTIRAVPARCGGNGIG